MVTRKVANRVKATAEDSRKRGTPNDMVIAKKTEEFHDSLTIIDEN